VVADHLVAFDLHEASEVQLHMLLQKEAARQPLVSRLALIVCLSEPTRLSLSFRLPMKRSNRRSSEVEESSGRDRLCFVCPARHESFPFVEDQSIRDLNQPKITDRHDRVDHQDNASRRGW
jgi:hypothetical protein